LAAARRKDLVEAERQPRRVGSGGGGGVVAVAALRRGVRRTLQFGEGVRHAQRVAAVLEVKYSGGGRVEAVARQSVHHLVY
jgi:hypothetical protein